jgi:hypothetical protein
MRFDWDNINLVTSAVSANRILRFTGASQYQVRGSGTTSSTTAFQVQNANASSSLSVRDDGLVTVGASIGLPGSAYVYWGDFNSSIQHTGAATNFRTYQDNQPWSFITANNSSVQAKIDTGYVRVKTGFSAVGNSPVTMSGWDGGGGTAGNILLVKGGNSGVGTSYAGGNGSDLILENGLATDNSLGFGGTPGSIIFKYGVYNNTASVEYGRLNSSGNFLIGTTAGSAKLLISGSSNSTLFEIDSPAVNNILYVSGSGNVGIGTGTPTYTLDVSGSARIQTAAAGVPNLLHISNLQTDGGPGTAIALYTGGNVSNASRIVALRSGTSGQSDIGLETTGVTRLFVAANSGNVGIGTTSPSAQLQVKGSGTTVSTTSLLVQNASNRTSLAISDDGRVGINVSPYDVYALAVDPISGSTGVYVAQRAVANNINEYRFVNSSGTPSAGSTAGRITWHTLSYLEGIYSSAVIDGYRAIDLRILGWSGSNAETARFTYDNKVGIGTTSPSAKLHVYTGNSGGVPLIVDGSNSSDGTIAKFGRGIGALEKNFYISSTNNQYINLGTEGDFKFKVGVTADQPYATGVSAMVITASGSVGVGTTSPSARMHILGSGTTSSTTALLVQNSNGTNLFKISDSAVQNAFMYSYPMTNNGGLTLQATVGTTETPALFLRPNTGLNGANIYVLDNKIYFRLINTNQVGSDSVYVFATDNRKAKFGVSADDSTTDASIYGKAIWDGGAAATFRRATASQTANIFNIQNESGSVNYFNVGATGNVGIGTTTPTSSLHISGSSSSILFEIDSPAVNNILYVSGSGNVGIGTGTPTSRLTVAGNVDIGGNFIGNGTAQYVHCTGGSGEFRFKNGSGNGWYYTWCQNSSDGLTERMRLSTSNNLLIGTTSDSARLTVKGSGTTSSTTALLVQNANASSSLAVLDNGYVGIGISSPARLLHLKAGSGATGAIRVDADNGNVANVLEVQTNGDWAFNTNSQETMRLSNASGGRVGIGTISPSAKLDVSGSGNFTNSLTITGSLLMPSGSNTRVGSDVLTAGSVLINNTTVTANSLIFVTPTAAGTLTGTLRITAIVPSTSFTVSSTSITDTAAFSYFIVN